MPSLNEGFDIRGIHLINQANQIGMLQRELTGDHFTAMMIDHDGTATLQMNIRYVMAVTVNEELSEFVRGKTAPEIKTV
ncbi:hypothetical protein D3C72_1292970 [compost metagenome]